MLISIKGGCTAAVSAALLLVTGVCAHAQKAEDKPPHIEEVVVHAHPLSGEGLAQASEVLEGEEFERRVGASLGETVALLPGIHSSSFGPAVGRPVIRGVGGPRVRVMEDRIDTMDASVSSGDHATAVEPFIADHVEVLKGSSTLLYGSGAIGGVVDVHSGRIPHAAPQGGVSGRALVRGQTNGGGTTAAARIDGGAGPLAWHADAFSRDFDAYDVPGFAESDAQRRLEGGGDDDEVRGAVPGTQFDGSGGAVGASYVGASGFAGVAFSRYAANYGLPGGHAEEDEEAPAGATPVLDMSQDRLDIEMGLDGPFAGVESINLRAGFNDYQHVEIEPSGEAGTTFANDAYEARIELVHEAWYGWRGVVGVHSAAREFSVLGEEAFVPPVDTDSLGLFWVGERPLGNWQLETGARVERVSHDPDAGRARDFSLFATSLGLVANPRDALTVTALVDVSSRAPVSEELYSNGPHLATGTFDVGDNELGRERALNASLTLDYDDGRWGYTATLYHTRFSNFIYQEVTADIEDGLSVAPYRQDDARFTGIDLHTFATLGAWRGAAFSLNARFDTVDATISRPDTKRLPRVSPTRLGLGLDAQWPRLGAGIEFVRVSAVDNVPPDQLPTDAYNDLRIDVTWRQPLPRGELSLFVHGRNLTDEEQRNHTSLVKDLVPMPGRNVEAGLRLSF